MSERLRESLSAVMDDEGDELELARVLRAVQDDRDLVDTWHRYHIVRAAMRGDAIAPGHGAARRRLQATLSDPDEGDSIFAGPADAEQPGADAASEPPGAETPAPPAAGGNAQEFRRPRWLRPVASLGVAASVVVAVVLGVQLGPNAEEEPAAVASTPSVPRSSGSSSVDPAPVADSERRRLNAYMLHHAQQRALNDRSGVVAIARVAAFESE